jgi:hypothetical protein
MPFYAQTLQEKLLVELFFTQHFFNSFEFGLLFAPPQFTGGGFGRLPSLITNEITQPEYSRISVSIHARFNANARFTIQTLLDRQNFYQSRSWVQYNQDLQFATAQRGWGFITALGCWGNKPIPNTSRTTKEFIWWTDFRANINLQQGQAIFIPANQLKIGWLI